MRSVLLYKAPVSVISTTWGLQIWESKQIWHFEPRAMVVAGEYHGDNPVNKKIVVEEICKPPYATSRHLPTMQTEALTARPNGATKPLSVRCFRGTVAIEMASILANKGRQAQRTRSSRLAAPHVRARTEIRGAKIYKGDRWYVHPLQARRLCMYFGWNRGIVR